jgi:hypothetical protein
MARPLGRTAIRCGMPRSSPLTPFRYTGAFVALGSLVLLATACSSSHPRATPDTTTTIVATTTTNPQEAAVLAAYRAAWAAFEHAGVTANAFDPLLPETMIDPVLQQVRRNLVGDKAHGAVARGTFTLHPHILAVTATAATVVDCAYSTSVLVYAATGKQVPPVTPPEYDGIKATLALVGSDWKVSQQVVTEGHCLPGY